jgi:hypothetical protein
MEFKRFHAIIIGILVADQAAEASPKKVEGFRQMTQLAAKGLSLADCTGTICFTKRPNEDRFFACTQLIAMH